MTINIFVQNIHKIMKKYLIKLVLKSLDKLVIKNHKIQVRESEPDESFQFSAQFCHILKSEDRRRENDIEATTLQKLVIKI